MNAWPLLGTWLLFSHLILPTAQRRAQLVSLFPVEKTVAKGDFRQAQEVCELDALKPFKTWVLWSTG